MGNTRRMMSTAEIARVKSKITCNHCGSHDRYITTCDKMHIQFPPKKKVKARVSKSTAELKNKDNIDLPGLEP